MSHALSQMLIAIFILGSWSSFALADTCDDPSRMPAVCREMRHLRSQILLLGAQRDTLQINYDLLKVVAEEMKAGSSRAIGHLKGDSTHGIGLVGVQALAFDLIDEATQKKGDAFVTANKIQQQCNNCHNNASPTSGHRWDDIFKSDWSVIYKKCNSPERNPLLCKNMHAMFSYYSGFFTAYQLGVQNFELTERSAIEIAKIAITLKENNLLHGLGETMDSVATEAKEVAQLAKNKDPDTFTRALAITQSCMRCHADRDLSSPKTSIRLKSLR
ncbi:MAG: hypothetical protein RJB66_149 [Pseudomonadota bacterium]|jgi:hypothetical protein